MGTYDGKPKRGLLYMLQLFVSRTALPLAPFLTLMLLLLLAGMSMREPTVVTRLTPHVTKSKVNGLRSTESEGTSLSRKLPGARAATKQQKEEQEQNPQLEQQQLTEELQGREDDQETASDLLEYNEDTIQVDLDGDAIKTAAATTAPSSSFFPSSSVSLSVETTQRSPYGYIDLRRNRTSQYLTFADIPEKVRVLSWDTRVLHVKGLLTLEEREHAIARSNNSSYGPMLSHGDAGKAHRSSSGTFILRRDDPVISNIDRKVAELSKMPEEFMEDLQVLHYEVGEEYRDHPDYMNLRRETHKTFDVDGGNRVATVLVYLRAPEEGGETVFPNIPRPESQVDSNEWKWSQCAQRGLAVRPVAGDAICFFSVNEDMSYNRKSIHSSCPVVRGNKWTATKWIHEFGFRVANSGLDRNLRSLCSRAEDDECAILASKAHAQMTQTTCLQIALKNVLASFISDRALIVFCQPLNLEA